MNMRLKFIKFEYIYNIEFIGHKILRCRDLGLVLGYIWQTTLIKKVQDKSVTA